MKLLIFILLLIPAFSFGQSYSLDIKLKEGDIIFHPSDDLKNVDLSRQDFNNNFFKKIKEEKKKDNVFFPLMWIDLSDTSKIKYYTKNGKNYIYQIIDKGFGKYNVFQDDDTKRPLFDKTSGAIIFPEGSFLPIKVNFKGYKFEYNLTSYQANSIYFIVFIPQYSKVDQLRKTVSL